MNLLQFAPRLCWPLDTGAKLRNYHLARVLSTRARISLLAFAEQDESTSDLEKVYERIEVVPRLGAYSFGKVLRGSLSSTPLPLLNYTTAEMKQALARVLSENEFDLVQVESVHLLNYLQTIRVAPKTPLVVCDWHNIESDLMRQYSDQERNLARRTYARKTARLMQEAEKRALTEFDAHLAVSEADARRLRAINPNARIFVIENGVHAADYASDNSTPRNRIVFVGSMDYHANIDGARSFARYAWPRLRAQKPELVCTIVGRHPSPKVRELSAVPGIEVTGSVADVRPYYREAVAAIVPLNVGGGSRLKILEAMAAGVPVVSTVRGAEGLAVANNQNILLVDSIEELASAIVRIIDDEDLRKRLIAGGRNLVAERYGWSTIGARLFEHYQELLSLRQTSSPNQT